MANRIKIVKKKTNTFNRFESDKHVRLSRSWRRNRGIDCPVRRRFRGYLRTPKAGYGSNKRTKHLLPNYKKKFLVHNVEELELLLMNNEKYCAEIAATVGAAKRIQILRRAKELSVKITNRKSAKITKLEEKTKKH